MALESWKPRSLTAAASSTSPRCVSNGAGLRALIAVLALGAVLTACGSNSAVAPLPGVGIPQEAPSDMREVVARCPAAGLDDPTAPRHVADLDGNGTEDEVVLLNEVPGDSSSDDPKRPLAIALRDDSGCLRVARKNDAIVPCERCGGLLGDPFAGIRAEGGGSFSVAIEGGSRERWYSWYTFTWSRELADWTLTRVQRGASDPTEGIDKSIDLTAGDFGVVRFADFDPETIPQVSLP